MSLKKCTLKSNKRFRYLGYAGRAVPVSFWDAGDLGFVTVSVAAFVTAITQQEEVLIIPLLTNLTVLQNKCVH